ncbi:hypothetical protein BDQ17DRAFT_1548125 [Cyathus striatus]|nr:hypothetical protein BDQ17DRAFT_1548125 [Cyathus striatus]
MLPVVTLLGQGLRQIGAKKARQIYNGPPKAERHCCHASTRATSLTAIATALTYILIIVIVLLSLPLCLDDGHASNKNGIDATSASSSTRPSSSSCVSRQPRHCSGFARSLTPPHDSLLFQPAPFHPYFTTTTLTYIAVVVASTRRFQARLFPRLSSSVKSAAMPSTTRALIAKPTTTNTSSFTPAVKTLRARPPPPSSTAAPPSARTALSCLLPPSRTQYPTTTTFSSFTPVVRTPPARPPPPSPTNIPPSLRRSSPTSPTTGTTHPHPLLLYSIVHGTCSSSPAISHHCTVISIHLQLAPSLTSN